MKGVNRMKTLKPRICVSVTAAQALALRNICDLTGASQSLLVRRALDVFLAKPYDANAKRWLDDAVTLGVPAETVQQIRVGTLPLEAATTRLREIGAERRKALLDPDEPMLDMASGRVESINEGIARRSASATPTLFVGSK
jgi:hypothetical protein